MRWAAGSAHSNESSNRAISHEVGAKSGKRHFGGSKGRGGDASLLFRHIFLKTA